VSGMLSLAHSTSIERTFYNKAKEIPSLEVRR
jgi:hypothetical protein